MKTSEVLRLTPREQFLYWYQERHRVYLKKEAGHPKPWTDDEVLQSYFFTNPYREHDKVTKWFCNNVREPLRNDPQVLMATIIFRWFNLPATGEALMDGPILSDNCEGCLLLNWDSEEAFKRLDPIRRNGGQLFTGAFMINSPPGKSKLEAILERIDCVWNDYERLIRYFLDYQLTLQEAHEWLTQYDGLGGFMAYEIVCDLRHTYLLEEATDVLTWCNPGPGAVRGMYRVLGRDFAKGNNSSSPPRPRDWDERTAELLAAMQEVAKRNKFPRVELREVEHSLCEYDKYMRAMSGDGRMKRTYSGKAGK
jgi:hypothetical protein